MPQQLSKVELDEVSLVDSGAAQHSKIVITKRMTKTEAGVDFPSAAYAYVPDPESPSTWKLRLWETPESKVTARQVGMAVAALGAGFRGNKVEIPSGDMAAVKAKVRAAWKSVHGEGDEMPDVLSKSEEVEKAPAGIQFVIGFPEDGGGSEVQSVIFDSSKWTAEKAKAWLKDHDMHAGKLDETENNLRFRQQDPEGFKRFRTITPGAGVSKALRAKASFSQLQAVIDRAVREKYDKPVKDLASAPGISGWLYIRDIFKDSVVIDQDGNTYRCDYTVDFDDDGQPQVTVGDKVPVEVVYQDIKKDAFVSDDLLKRLNVLRVSTLLKRFR